MKRGASPAAALCRPRTGAVLRAIWQWRDREAQQADRPSFHILQNSAMIEAAKRFVAGETPEFRHLSDRRRRGISRRGAGGARAAGVGLAATAGTRRAERARPGFDKKLEELRRRRDQHAKELAIDPAFIAPRSALEGIAADPERSETFLVQWQRELLGL